MARNCREMNAHKILFDAKAILWNISTALKPPIVVVNGCACFDIFGKKNKIYGCKISI